MATVLICDDSFFARKSLSKVVAKEGHDILEASDGQEGLTMIIEHEPDCVLLDLLMPELDGVDVLHALNDRAIKTPVIVVSADVQESTRQQCMALGARAFINKPPTEEQLQQALRTILH